MRAVGANVNDDIRTECGELIVRDDGEQPMRTGVEMHVACATEQLDENNARADSGSTLYRRPIGDAGEREVFRPNADRRRGGAGHQGIVGRQPHAHDGPQPYRFTYKPEKATFSVQVHFRKSRVSHDEIKDALRDALKSLS